MTEEMTLEEQLGDAGFSCVHVSRHVINEKAVRKRMATYGLSPGKYDARIQLKEKNGQKLYYMWYKRLKE